MNLEVNEYEPLTWPMPPEAPRTTNKNVQYFGPIPGLMYAYRL